MSATDDIRQALDIAEQLDTEGKHEEALQIVDKVNDALEEIAKAGA